MKDSFEFFEIPLDRIDEVVDLINRTNRGETSQAGWTTEAAWIEGNRTSREWLLEERAQKNRILYGAREPGKSDILGCLVLEDRVTERGQIMYLGMLSVDPLQQNRSIGKFLMRQAEILAISRGAILITLGVLNRRDELIAWYERQGYRKTGLSRSIEGIDARFGHAKVEGLSFFILEKGIVSG